VDQPSVESAARVTLRGEGLHLVSLWWPDQKDPLPTLIEGSSDFGVEDLSIFTQGGIATSSAAKAMRASAGCASGPIVIT